ncbi:putative integral membrane protein [Durotheca rogersii]|uniref:putative integral membrane protein n=1 Tax=Durotheca rogersii TaxID=419775 RepID=UPI0022202628|nr:putative integral membrane protein [Durotheca rogersii]KAI5860847.1 putative integral membrane protein [Durotheca rogersii]
MVIAHNSSSMSETLVSPPTFTPALEPPPGTTSNPEHPASLAHLADISIGVCLPLITIFFMLRSYVRIFVKHSWIFEDVLVTTAWAGTVAYCGIMRATMAYHGGQHAWDITRDEFHQASYWFNVASIEYGVMIGITKLAVLWLYRRVFSPVRWSAFDISIVVLIATITGFYGATTIVKIFECSPREKIWNHALPGKCVQTHWILNISGGFNTVTDYLILLLPVQAVRNLQMDTLKRVLVVLAFTFGLWYVFPTRAGEILQRRVEKTLALGRLRYHTGSVLIARSAPIFATIGFVVRIQRSGNPDTSWNQPEILLWGVAELASGNLCVCFPELAFVFHWKRRKGSDMPHRPTASVIESNRRTKPPSDPYFTKCDKGICLE